MDDLPPIPTPFHQRWREFRIQVLPIIVFLITVGAIVYLWRSYVHPSELVGAVETNTVSVVSTDQGSLDELIVQRFETVAQGQPIGRIALHDPGVTEASLKAIEADLKLMQARMNLDKFRNRDSMLQMRLDLLTEQVALNLSQIRLKHAEAELRRAQALYGDKLITEGMPLSQGQGLEPGRFNFGLDVAIRDRDLLQSEVASRSNSVQQIQATIDDFAKSPAAAEFGESDTAIEEAIRTQQEELRLINQPTILKAPMDGVVTAIYKHAGEKVVRGDVILTISSPRSRRVVGYVRQPINRIPTTNDLAVVSTRAHRRQVGRGAIVRVGVQLEQINPLLLSPDATRMEMGLPFLVQVPDGMSLVPGEFVDLQIEYATP